MNYYISKIKELPYDRAQKIVPIDNNLKFGSGEEEWNTSNSKSNFSETLNFRIKNLRETEIGQVGACESNNFVDRNFRDRLCAIQKWRKGRDDRPNRSS